MRRSRHWRVRADSSISAMLSQEPCLGVWWISSWGEGSGLGRLEGFVEGSEGVGVEVVHHQHDLGDVGVVDGEQMVDLVCPVHPGPLLAGDHSAPSGQGFDPDEDRAGPLTHVLGVLLAVMPR
jgi:hypothetical protein